VANVLKSLSAAAALLLGAALALGAALGARPALAAPAPQAPVIVSSKLSSESAMIGHMIRLLLNADASPRSIG